MKEYIIKVNESDLTPSERMCIKDYHPVELVRCKDCKYILSASHVRQCCRNMSHWQEVDDDWFCAGGKRKELYTSDKECIAKQ